MKDLKITKGNWLYSKYTPYDYGVYSDCKEREGRDIALVRDYANDEETLANAELITEAGNVANETGLMPRELLDERDTYKAILNDIREMWCDNEINMRTINEAMEAFESYLATE